MPESSKALLSPRLRDLLIIVILHMELMKQREAAISPEQVVAYNAVIDKDRAARQSGLRRTVRILRFTALQIALDGYISSYVYPNMPETR